jgi:hypothetical protein
MCTSCWHANGSNENTNTESTLWEREVIWITGDSKEMHNGYLFVLERISNECVNWKNDLHGRALHRIIELFPCLVASSYPRSTMRESHSPQWLEDNTVGGWANSSMISWDKGAYMHSFIEHMKPCGVWGSKASAYEYVSTMKSVIIGSNRTDCKVD